MAETMTEKDWQALVLEAARRFGWICYHAFDSRRSAPGFPDLVLVRPPRVVFAELKTAEGKLTGSQALWARELSECPGVETYVWRPGAWQEVAEILRRRGGER